MKRPKLPYNPVPSAEANPYQRHEDAACRHVEDPDIFFPKVQQHGRRAEAVRVCQSCPYVAGCLVWATRTQQEHGVWGASTPTQRKTLRRGILTADRETLLAWIDSR
jgi:WhiB family transcriptional regulator, redox-sensing transcriptional regulator